MKKILLLFSFFICLQANAQYGGNYSLSEEYGVAQLMNKFKAINQSQDKVDGYRLQICQEYTSETVYQKEAEFNRFFPQWSSYVTYKQPLFKLRAGNFVDRLEAFKALKMVKRKFPGAFLVPYEVDMSSIRY